MKWKRDEKISHRRCDNCPTSLDKIKDMAEIEGINSNYKYMCLNLINIKYHNEKTLETARKLMDKYSPELMIDMTKEIEHVMRYNRICRI